MKPVDLAGRTGASDPLLPIVNSPNGRSRKPLVDHGPPFAV